MPLARADVRDVCFAHWPVDPDGLAPVVPAALAPATRDGSAWMSVLAQRTRAGLGGLPGRYEFPQVACRTYVVPADSDDRSEEDAVGVFFLRVAAPSRFATLGGRIVFGIPYIRAPVDFERTGESIRVRAESGGGTARYDASFAPERDPTPADPDSLDAWLTERYRYYLPDGRYGEIGHEPWRLATATGAIEDTELLDTVGVEPSDDPLLRYSPGTDVRLTRRA
ncbi:YqjF family protein [Halosimplex salinum]|uniref:YqjF family protein n=1 Tax=Halosimplex salinum TaxID=1710538 RepID=UPI000F47007D|nr:DUF2071 domain-containing protein [Halosimplex salinum]